MANPNITTLHRQSGTTMIEVLVTVVILAFGLLGIAAFQGKAQVGSMESYQRAQAVVLMEDMHARMTASPKLAASYVTAGVGTGDAPAACNALSNRAQRDLCEWSQALRGTSEVKSGANVGAMTGARGCVRQIVAASDVPEKCQHGIYLISVAWQGLHKTKPPAAGLTCGKDLYGEEQYRRVISTRISVAVPDCKMSSKTAFIPIP